jgi:hypothetical protein
MRDVSAHLSTTLACLLIAAAVLVSGTHAKDLASLTSPNAIADTHKTDDAAQHIVKIAPELHHHSDNSAKVQIANDGQQADHRSLRLHEHKKETRGRLATRLRGLWLAASLSFTV